MSQQTPAKFTPVTFLLYITTHLSDPHKACLLGPAWRGDGAAHRFHPAIVTHRHFFVPEAGVAWVRVNFPLATASSPRAGRGAGRQGGAIEAIANPVSRLLFRSFDWVVRLNPDVVVLDFAPFYAHMVGGYEAVVGTCSGGRVLTDFTVFRAAAIDRDAVEMRCPPGIGPLPNAECEMTRLLRNATLAGLVKVVYKTRSTCRMTWKGVVMHVHNTSACSGPTLSLQRQQSIHSV
mmetsp:Transcript_41441/g.137812  ORF Transcript_41441/g.137812 Transcript_41441/m.137812 type:complete len:234 (+) Transcript_41441:20-721(+)